MRSWTHRSTPPPTLGTHSTRVRWSLTWECELEFSFWWPCTWQRGWRERRASRQRAFSRKTSSRLQRMVSPTNQTVSLPRWRKTREEEGRREWEGDKRGSGRGQWRRSREKKKGEAYFHMQSSLCFNTHTWFSILQTWEIGEKPASGNSESELHVCISNFQFYQYTKVYSSTLQYIPVHHSIILYLVWSSVVLPPQEQQDLSHHDGAKQNEKHLSMHEVMTTVLLLHHPMRVRR